MPYCMAGAAPVTGERDATRRERGVDGDTRDALFCQLDSETFVLLQRKGATAAPHHVYSAPAPEARRHHARTFAHDNASGHRLLLILKSRVPSDDTVSAH